MMERDINVKTLSLFFSYPETLPDMELLDAPAAKSTLVELQNQYVRLFINALPEVPCPPYGSVYLEGSCMGATTVMLRNLYRKYGFETDEMPDHIAVELEFLHYLALQSKHEEKAIKDFVFLLNHLKSWTPAFFERVEKYDADGFYNSTAKAARKALDIEGHT